jgi:hypothetical protein
VSAITDLQPCSTYCLRLVAVADDGSKSEPGEMLVIDTQGKLLQSHK